MTQPELDVMQDRERFEKHLDRAFEIVHGWPEWKQNILRKMGEPHITPEEWSE